jgi:formylglycine-generating enzyme required for sulfatase activity
MRAIDNALEIYIPEGEFLMGCDPQHNGGFPCNFDELPLHPVFLSAYFMDAYEVTNQQYRMCMESGNCPEPVYKNSSTRDSYYDNPTYDRYPVVGITWYEAQAYCQWVGGRLPTEAEWEKAARGTTIRAYPWGDEEPNCDLANSYDNTSGKHCVGDTAPVGSYPAGTSPYGLYDMAGNVWEWVGDWYSTNYYAYSPYENPTGRDTGDDKVIRGGSWSYSWSKLRVAYNSNHHPEQRNLNFGFRCVRPIE